MHGCTRIACRGRHFEGWGCCRSGSRWGIVWAQSSAVRRTCCGCVRIHTVKRRRAGRVCRASAACMSAVQELMPKKLRSV